MILKISHVYFSWLLQLLSSGSRKRELSLSHARGSSIKILHWKVVLSFHAFVYSQELFRNWMFLAVVKADIWHQADCISVASLNVSAYGSQNIFLSVVSQKTMCWRWEGCVSNRCGDFASIFSFWRTHFASVGAVVGMPSSGSASRQEW